jgi:hypothetical protein
MFLSQLLIKYLILPVFLIIYLFYKTLNASCIPCFCLFVRWFPSTDILSVSCVGIASNKTKEFLTRTIKHISPHYIFSSVVHISVPHKTHLVTHFLPHTSQGWPFVLVMTILARSWPKSLANFHWSYGNILAFLKLLG